MDKEKLKLIVEKGQLLEKTGVLGVAKAFIDVEKKIDIVREDVTKISEELKKKLESELVLEIDRAELKGDTGEPGVKGDSYILTDQDKQEIAKSITVPVVEKQIIIQKTVTHETPIVTENIVEKAVTDEPIIIAEKLNTLKDAIELDVIKGLNKFPTQEKMDFSLGVLDKRTQFLLNKSSAPASVTIATTPIASGTVGAVLFEGAGNFIQEDATNFFWNNTNKRLGLGTNNPTATLHTVGPSIASVGSGNGTAGSSVLTVLGSTGGATSASSGSVNGGLGGGMNLTAGVGGATTGTPGTGSGGAGGNVDINSGDGGIGTTFGGNGGTVTLAGGLGGSSVGTPGNGGTVSIKGGNGWIVGNSAGGNVYIIGGLGNGTSTNGNIYLAVSPSATVRGGVSIATNTPPTARLFLGAGSATANTAPLKFNSGALLTVAEAGAVEFLTDAFYATITTGAARKTFAFLESPVFTGVVTIPTPFTLGAISVTTIGTQLNYLNAAVGTTGTTSTNLVFSTSPTLVTPTFTTNFTSPIWKPVSDSTTAIQINKADGTTNIFNIDTTNSRVGINTTAPDSVLHEVQPSNVIADPINPVVTSDAGAGTYNAGDSLQYQIYSYVTIYGQTYYSSVGLITSPTILAFSGDKTNVSWTAVAGATGYRVLQNYNSSGYVKYQDFATNNFIDAFISSWATGSTVTPKTASFNNRLGYTSGGIYFGLWTDVNALISKSLSVGTTTSPTALLLLGAGAAAVNSAPLKFTSGTNLTSAEAGAVEYDGTNFYMSPSTTRKRIPLINNATASNGFIPIGNGTDYTTAAISGTTNQVTVTNGAGTITLSTPQNIATTSSPQFTRLGIGLASSATKILTITAPSTGQSAIGFTSGGPKTTPVAGDFEFNTDDVFFTITTSAARKRFLFADPVGGLTSGRVPYATTNGRLTDLSTFVFDGTNLGIGVAAPTAILHLAAGSTGANTAPLKFTSGTLNTTAVAAQYEYNGNHYLTNVALLRMPVGGTLFDHFADVTVGGAETDIYTDTTIANTLNGNGDKLVASYGVNFVTAGTQLTRLQVYFAGTSIWDSTAVAPSTGTTSARVYVEIIRVSSTVVRYSVSLNTTGASGYTYAKVGELTGLTLSNTNIIKLTGISSGVGSGAGDIIGKMSYIEFKPAH